MVSKHFGTFDTFDTFGTSSTFFIEQNSLVNNGPRKLRNPLSWLLIFLLVSFNKIPRFSKERITFIISFISWFVGVILEFYIFLLRTSIHVFTNCFAASLSNVDILRVTIYSPILQAGNIKGKGKNPPKCNILDYWVFNYSILVREPFEKAL